MAAPFESRKDAQRVYISRQEASPLTQPISRRQHVNRLTFGTDGTRFPGEPHIEIMPNMDRCFPGGCEKKDTIIDGQRKRNEDYDKMRLKLDFFKVFGPKRKGMPPGGWF